MPVKKEKKKKKKHIRWWLSNGGGSTNYRRDTGGDMTGLPVMVALVLSSLSTLWCSDLAFSSFHHSN